MTIWKFISINEDYRINDPWFQNGGLEIWYDLCRQNNLVEDGLDTEDVSGSYIIPASIRLLDWTTAIAFEKFSDIKGWNNKNPQIVTTHQEADWILGEVHC